jgi:type VI secretion system protein ImpH
LSIPKFKWLRLSSILCSRIRNKEGLLLLLREFFPAVGFGLTEFVPSRARLTERPRLGRAPRSGAFRLSRHSIVGESQLDYMGRVRLDVGPISYDDYLDFIPGSRNLALLRSLMDMYLNDGLEYDVRFVVRSRTIHRLALTDRRPRLGLSYWLGRPRTELVGVFYPYERLAGTVS